VTVQWHKPLVAMYKKGLKTKAIAEALDKPYNSVKTAIRRLKADGLL
jgi:transposase